MSKKKLFKWAIEAGWSVIVLVTLAHFVTPEAWHWLVEWQLWGLAGIAVGIIGVAAGRVLYLEEQEKKREACG